MLFDCLVTQFHRQRISDLREHLSVKNLILLDQEKIMRLKKVIVFVLALSLFGTVFADQCSTTCASSDPMEAAECLLECEP